ncbi:MAG: N-6 DNA methylase [Dehalococcoidia bacterium]
MSNSQLGSRDFLNAVYRELKFETGKGYFRLADEIKTPSLLQLNWIDQARLLDADSIFFVGDYPTVLFFNLDVNLSNDSTEIEDKIRELHVKIWNTNLIPLFFVALPGEIRIYSAYQRPARDVDTWLASIRTLERIRQISDLIQIWDYSRPVIESGLIFDRKRGSFDRRNRVDRWLLKNLRLLRQKLEGENNEKREFAHALIGRSIFIRYLEDRKVLVEGYFLDKRISRNRDYRRYTDVLVDKEDTYNFFRKLGNDFNGDLFPLSEEEEETVSENDLQILRDFLRGRSMEGQPDLLFWAYRFDIIPTELISSIYEEFYHEYGGEEDKGTHYTPMPLVDLILTETLTNERLEANATVLDCACGSGVFLVEAFKRMAYYECNRQNMHPSQLSREKLIEFLTERIVGIDLNKAAIQVAALSLYLSFLDFREPPDIREHMELPKLVYDLMKEGSGKTLFCSDAFYLTSKEKSHLGSVLDENRKYRGRSFDVVTYDKPVIPLDNREFDIIVGNPPWGSIKPRGDQTPIYWCKAFRYPVGDKELSQCFIWRARNLLRPGGEIGLLVSTGVLFKHNNPSKKFREQWLQTNHIRAIYNFAHVRNVFFRKQKKEAIAPFMAVMFSPLIREDSRNNKFLYCSVKKSAFIEQLQALIIDKSDLRWVNQEDVLLNNWLWKAYIWGNLNDVDLIGELKACYCELRDKVSDYGRGYIRKGPSMKKSTSDLGVEFELDDRYFERNVEFSKLLKTIAQGQVHRLGNTKLYDGPRLLLKRGIARLDRKIGRIRARFSDEPFAFKSTIIGFKLDKLNYDEQQIILGVFLSSLANYYLFLTCSTWGFWHDEIHELEYLSMPINIPVEEEAKQRIIKAVKKITEESIGGNRFDLNMPERRSIQEELDESIFDAYNLSDTQKDLVRDFSKVTLDFYYNGNRSDAAKPPTIDHLESYRDAFVEVWRDRLAERGKELECRIYAPSGGLLVGMSFDLVNLGEGSINVPLTDDSEWRTWLVRLGNLVKREWISGIYIDRVIKELSRSSMLLVKRAERRRWTRSEARTDAQELLTEVFKLEWENVEDQ